MNYIILILKLTECLRIVIKRLQNELLCDFLTFPQISEAHSMRTKNIRLYWPDHSYRSTLSAVCSCVWWFIERKFKALSTKKPAKRTNRKFYFHFLRVQNSIAIVITEFGFRFPLIHIFPQLKAWNVLFLLFCVSVASGDCSLYSDLTSARLTSSQARMYYQCRKVDHSMISLLFSTCQTK